jgi:hypothetical protein
MTHSVTISGETLYFDGRQIPLREPVRQALYQDGVLVVVVKATQTPNNLIGINLDGEILWRANEIAYRDPNPYEDLWQDEQGRLCVGSWKGHCSYVDARTGRIQTFRYEH